MYGRDYRIDEIDETTPHRRREEFDAGAKRHRLRVLLDCDYAKCIYGSTISRVTVRSQRSNHHSEIQTVSAKSAEAVGELVAKKAEIEMQAAIDAYRQQLKDLESQRDMKVIEAKLKAYSIEAPHEVSKYNSVWHKARDQIFPFVSTRNQEELCTKLEDSTKQMLQNFMSLSRLPAREPSVFFGDSLRFVGWSSYNRKKMPEFHRQAVLSAKIYRWRG